MFTVADIDAAIANRSTPALTVEMLTEFKTLRSWVRRRWMTGDEPIGQPITIDEAVAEQKRIEKGRG